MDDHHPGWTEEMDALFWAMHHLPPAPATVMKAHKAQSDLWDRIRQDDHWPLTRDEQRLDRRYSAIAAAYVADVVKTYRQR